MHLKNISTEAELDLNVLLLIKFQDIQGPHYLRNLLAFKTESRLSETIVALNGV